MGNLDNYRPKTGCCNYLDMPDEKNDTVGKQITVRVFTWPVIKACVERLQDPPLPKGFELPDEDCPWNTDYFECWTHFVPGSPGTTVHCLASPSVDKYHRCMAINVKSGGGATPLHLVNRHPTERYRYLVWNFNGQGPGDSDDVKMLREAGLSGGFECAGWNWTIQNQLHVIHQNKQASGGLGAHELTIIHSGYKEVAGKSHRTYTVLPGDKASIHPVMAKLFRKYADRLLNQYRAQEITEENIVQRLKEKGLLADSAAATPATPAPQAATDEAAFEPPETDPLSVGAQEETAAEGKWDPFADGE